MRLTIKGENIDALTQTLGGETADTMEAAYRAAYGGYRGGAVGIRAGSAGFRAGYVGFRTGYRGYAGYRGYVGGYRGYAGYRGGFFGYPWGRYGGYWGGWRGYGYGRPWLGAGLAFGLGYSPALYPSYYSPAPVYYGSPSYYYSSPIYSSPCACAYGVAAAPVQQSITLESAPPGYAIQPEQLNVAPRQAPALIQPERLVPMPRTIPNDGTFQYDGGPLSPVPLPRAAPAPTTVPPKAAPTPNRVVSVPKTSEKPSKFAYSAYGEEQTKTNFAADRVTPDTRKLAGK